MLIICHILQSYIKDTAYAVIREMPFHYIIVRDDLASDCTENVLGSLSKICIQVKYHQSTEEK